MPQRLLALDTATEACSVALWVDGAVTEHFEIAGREHTQRLLPMTHALLAEAGVVFTQLDALACGVGPGSFAGVRIAVGFAKGLGLVLDRPLVAVGSLEMLAQAALDAGAAQVFAAIDARMDEVYFGAFAAGAQGVAQPLSPAGVAAPQSVPLAAAGAWTGVGTGWGRYESTLRTRLAGSVARIDGDALPRAGAALRLAVPRWQSGATVDADTLAPLYLRDKVALTLDEQQRLRESRS